MHEISDLRINDLHGRCLSLAAKNEQDSDNIILVVYGHHSDLERNLGLIQYLSGFGQILMPDIPGFGGMDSFYKEGLQPSLENYANYLHSFIKLKLQDNQKFVFVGFSFGFLIITKLLQLKPELESRVKLVVSLVGFASGQSLKFSKRRYRIYLYLSRLLRLPPVAWLFRRTLLTGFVLRKFYRRTSLAKAKFEDLSQQELDKALDKEIQLWQCNDVRTWAFTSEILLTVDLTGQPYIDLDLCHIYMTGDHFVNNGHNAKCLKACYRETALIAIESKKHAPSIISDEESFQDMVPEEFKKIMANRGL